MDFKLNIANIVFIVFSITLLIQLIYFFYFFIRIRSKKKNEKNLNKKPISVIIAARNEEQNLMQFLPKIFEQNYPEFEIIVVNDRSWDESIDVLQAFAQKHENLHVVEISDKGVDGFKKKMAITLGIKAAKHDRLVFIDADCYPSSKNWLNELSQSFHAGKTIILGASPYLKEKGFVNKLIRFDAAAIAIQYLSFAKAGIPYMGVGRNLSYTQEIYDSVRGFKSHYHIPSGDDDLFVNEAATQKNTEVVFNEDALTFTIPKKSFHDWWYQKKRHLTTGKLYKIKHKLLIGGYPLSLLFMYITLIILLVIHNLWYIALSAMAFRILLQMFIFSRPLKIMGSKDLLIITPIMEIVLLIINPLLLMSKKNR